MIREVSRDVSLLLAGHKEKTGQATGLIIDESSHLKKGKYSVGVARQYAGIVGKVDNCQVGVYGSMGIGQVLYLNACFYLRVGSKIKPVVKRQRFLSLLARIKPNWS